MPSPTKRGQHWWKPWQPTYSHISEYHKSSTVTRDITSGKVWYRRWNAWWWARYTPHPCSHSQTSLHPVGWHGGALYQDGWWSCIEGICFAPEGMGYDVGHLPWISHINSCIITENWIYVYVTLLTGYHLRYKLLKWRHY